MYCPSQIRSSGGTISVDTIDCYMHQLQQYKAIATCDDLLRLFVVQDFSTETLSLKVTHTLNVFNLSLTLYYPFSVSIYCFVSRSVRQFTDGIEWIYVCSCDPNASKLTKTLGTHINCQYSQYTQDFPECIHMMVVNRISSTIDALHGLTPSQDFSGIAKNGQNSHTDNYNPLYSSDHTYSSDHFENPSLVFKHNCTQAFDYGVAELLMQVLISLTGDRNYYCHW